ncbi:hypothetical protein [Pedobacter steynii]|uniref:Uncharacterized protein n=1 Tax=Pedobacter steynii TaxID=430522 RepID=A0A1D7QNH3_9SPHI|nr:hypothetical protein [Pedobacter steynii]AOM80218.1 hypothetical protein BFS30_25475 [Pedobacter steynii]
MKKLEKLNEKKVEGLEKIQGGRLAGPYDLETSDGGGGSTYIHEPTAVVRTGHFICDHTPD